MFTIDALDKVSPYTHTQAISIQHVWSSSRTSVLNSCTLFQ